jgi:hypothetical protein
MTLEATRAPRTVRCDPRSSRVILKRNSKSRNCWNRLTLCSNPSKDVAARSFGRSAPLALQAEAKGAFVEANRLWSIIFTRVL